MIICHSRKFIFFSFPKTGSESIRSLLEPWSEEPVVPYRARRQDQLFYPHMSPAEANDVFDARGWAFGDYLKITCVRNPFDRLVSLYRMIREVDGLWQMQRTLRIGPPDFDTWVRRSRPDGSGGGGRPHQRWRRYGTWSAKTWCAGRIDRVIRLEHIQDDLAAVVADLGICPSEVPHLNARGAVELAAWYSADLAALVAKRYRWDLERFGYDQPRIGLAA